MSTATYTVTMAELKEPAHSGLWQNYGSPVQIANGRFSHPAALDPVLANAAAAPQAPSPHSARPRTDGNSYPYARYSQDETDMYGRHHPGAPGAPHPALTPHHSYPNLKRSYSQTEQAPPPPPYTEMVQDMREDGSKLNVNQGHKLLSFKRMPDKHTIVDQHGRVQQLDLSAQLHGMFFLSEMPTSTSDGTVLQPELTCYRRNLFQISGTLITPRGLLSVVAEGGEPVAISSTELTISAIESVDGHPVRLIVIPWKTPPPNSPEISQSPDQEPAALPLIPFQEDGSENEGEYAVYPIGWRRLQFRIATANNGRRKELQQHFVLHLKAVGTLSSGSKVVLAEATTAPVVVRGRSPRNFQARKEIPLLGSSAGSRGQALVETGMGIVAGPLSVKPHDKARAMTMEMPRSSFTFSAGPKMPPSPLSMRSNSYPTWNTTQMPLPPASAGSYPATTMAADSYQKMPLSGSPNYTSEPQEMPMQQTSMPSMQLSLVSNDAQQPGAIRTQYAYVHGTSAPPPQLSLPTAADANLNVPRYLDNNPRPTKSPRHSHQDPVHSASSMGPSTDASNDYRYGPPSYVGVSGGSSDLGHQQHQNPHQTHQSPSQAPHQQTSRSQQQSPAQPLPPPIPHPQHPQHQQQAHQQPQSQASYGSVPQDNANGQNPPSGSTAQAPPRDYFPPSASWTSTAGETNPPAYANGEPRPYSFPDQYKTGHNVKAEALPQPHGYGAPRGSFDAMNHYSWNAT